MPTENYRYTYDYFEVDDRGHAKPLFSYVSNLEPPQIGTILNLIYFKKGEPDYKVIRVMATPEKADHRDDLLDVCDHMVVGIYVEEVHN